MEENFEFKKALEQIHKKNVRDFSVIKGNDFEINEKTVLCTDISSDVVDNAIKDFAAYMQISMGIDNIICKNTAPVSNYIKVVLNKNIGKASGYKGYRVTVTHSNVLIEGYDERGIMQGVYSLEEKMSFRKAPFIEIGCYEKKALFSTRFSQSPLGMFEFSDECFSLMTHAGYDAIDLWIKGLNKDHMCRFLDMNDICDRAEKYGIDIYIALYALHSKNPIESDAEEFYDKMYGTILNGCPKIKGIILEGETTEFKSNDSNAGKSPRSANYEDNIPTGKCTPGWWPCNDYPEWVALIQKVAKKYNSDIKIILSTYNWGYAPKDLRIKLINNLPEDVIVLATWDMFQQIKYGNSVEDVVDYTLSFAGPGDYFISEAEACKKKGLKIYSIANTSGKTWDFGVIPYEPMPYQWIERFNNIAAAHYSLDLDGLIENIHYSFYPSFINELEKEAFSTNAQPLELLLDKIIVRDYGKENLQKVKLSFKYWSDAIRFYPPTNEDQYGTFRIGPSYPFWINNPTSGLNPLPDGGKQPNAENAMFGNSIYFSSYTPDVNGRNSLPGVRIFDEIKSISKMIFLLNKGITVIDNAKKNEELNKLIGIIKFMVNSCKTTINYKKFYINIQKLSIAKNKVRAGKIISEIEKILLIERENVLNTIPLVQNDSRLGYEPSMQYRTDEKGLRWKLKQIDFELNNTIPLYRKSNSL